MAKNKIEIPKLILDHLLQYGNASILGLGTLSFVHHSAYLSDDKSQVFPPSNSVQFSDNTDNTDQFVTYVANRLDIKSKKAFEKVDKYAQHIINHLLNYGKADIPGIGHFVKGDGEDIQFSQNQGEVNSEYFGLTPVKLKPIQFYKEGEMKDAPMAVSTASLPNRTAAASTIAASTSSSTPPPYNYNDDDDSSWLKPLLWIFGLVLLCALLYKGCETYKSNQSNDPPVVQIDSTAIKNIQSGNGNNKSVDNPNEGSTGEIIDTSTKVKKPTECVIILGAFDSPRNVIEMTTKISQMGYTPYEEYFDTMDLTRVGFKFDCSQRDLREFMLEVREDIEKDAWYLVPRITVE